jgi:CRISPR-associated protein Cmr5
MNRPESAPTHQRTLEQQRAAHAWQAVQEVRQKDYASKYRSLARGAAADLQMNGLGQTLAFWQAKGYSNGQPKSGSEHAELLKHVSSWLVKQLGLKEKTDLTQWIISAQTPQYRRATAEAIAYLTWLRRFAEAELPEKSGE